MSLRRSPLLTPRSLAARRANALKSTGPRTPCGKARVSLNALKHGRGMGPAGRAARFRERLLRACCIQQEVLYGGFERGVLGIRVSEMKDGPYIADTKEVTQLTPLT